VTPPVARLRRLFFALWPDEATREALRHTTRKIVRHCGGRPVPPANFHLTLAFLGHVPEEQVAAAVAAARATPIARQAVVLDALGWFERPQALWLGPSAPVPALQAHAVSLRAALASAGLGADIVPFHPHVTLARRVLAPGQLAPPRPVAWPVRGFALVESRTHAEGARYVVLEEFPALPA
jgi:2'-5' RNA ligase